MNENITAIIFTLNEERRIEAIYQNLKDFCKIIVFDGGSTDGTEEFCLRRGIKFVQRPLDNSEMRLNTIRWVHKNTPTEYVLHVYGAHFYPRPLLEKFAATANENILDAVYHDVVVYRYGQIVHKPLLRRIAAACVFYKKNIVNLSNSKIHDELSIKFNPKTMIRLPGRDDLSLHLFQDEDCESFSKKTLNYVVLEARQRYARGERMNSIRLILGPVKRGIYGYFRTGAFSRGSKGLIYTALSFIYDLKVNIILWELTNNLTLEYAIKKNSDKRAFLQAINNQSAAQLL